MAFDGSVTYSGANDFIDPLSCSTSWPMGPLTCSSNTGLRGRNHSRRLLRTSPRKNLKASSEKPGKPDAMNPPFIINVMPTAEEAHGRLAGIPNLTVLTDAPLSRYTRFGIGGPADLYAETENAEAFIAAWQEARSSGIPTVVI